MSELVTAVPVLARPQNVDPLVESHHSATPGSLMFIVDHDDEVELAALEKYAGDPRVVVRTMKVDGRGTCPQKWNHALSGVGKAEWMLCAADDVRFHPGWWEATKSLRADPKIGVIGTNDLGNPRVTRGYHTTHPLVRVEYARRRGTVDHQRNKVVHDGYSHWAVDDELVQTAKARAAWAFCKDAVVEHLHPYWQKAEMDAVYKLGESTGRADQLLWEERKHLVYQAGEPFPHVVLDGVVDDEMARQVCAEFPPVEDPRWKRFANDREKKMEGSDPSMWGPQTRRLHSFFMGEEWRQHVLAWTQIPDAIPDTLGGGMHRIERGGLLNVHTDFNIHPNGLYRRLNQLAFLNVGWQPEWGGDLLLCDDTPAHEVVQRISPVAGRLVLFTTSDKSWHGHPEPVACPEDRARCSYAMYWFQKEQPAEFVGEHDTVFA